MAGALIDSRTEHENYIRIILEALTYGATLAHVRAALAHVARQSSDRQLKTYLAPVRRVLASAAIQSMDESVQLKLPLDRPPYNALVAYCRRCTGRDLPCPAR
jgi:hypothetical protein